MPNIHDGHRQRMKEEFRRGGLANLPPHKILEILLYYVIRQGDTNPVAHRLIDRFGSLSGVLNAPVDMLCEVKGIKLETATYLKLLAETVRVYMDDYAAQHDNLTDIATAKEYMRYKFLGKQSEGVFLACLAANGKLLYGAQIVEGSPESVQISPADIAKLALRVGSTRVILAHNHPNGICNPSTKDLMATNMLWNELKRIGIELADHIITAPDGVYSMQESGMFPR